MLRFHRLTAGLMCSLCLFAGSGCAIHYFDPETGTEHLWGFGHMRMKVEKVNEGVQAIVTGTDTLGIVAGSVASERRIAVGWERLSKIHVMGEDAALILEWPTSDLFTVRVGSELPPPFEKQHDDNDKTIRRP